jgi:hypothetical protein
MFHLGPTIALTIVTVADGCRERLTMQQIYMVIQQFCSCRDVESRITYHPSALSSAVHELKACRSSEKWLTPRRCMLCQRTGFLDIYCHELIGKQLVQLRGCLRSFYELMCKQTFNSLAIIEVM